jgi:PAS domain S-box-containing protein
MTTPRKIASSAPPIQPGSTTGVILILCLVGLISYLTARLGGALVLRPEMMWPLWPGCAFVLAALLLTPYRLWAGVLLAGLAGFSVYDLQEGLPARTIFVLLAADGVEILIAAFGIRYLLGPVPRLDSVRALAKYSIFAVILAPVTVATLSSSAFSEDSWLVAFFSESLALLTITTAIVGWTQIALARPKKPAGYYLEAIAMSAGVAALSYIAIFQSGSQERPALLYSLVPFLLWAALRFGIAGTASSVVLVALIAILGAVHGSGPFRAGATIDRVLSLQLFLLVAGGSFMVLAAAVEEDKKAEREQRELNSALEAQTRLMESREELLKIFVNNVPVGVAMLDRDMRYVQVSQRWCADYSVQSSEILGRSHYEVHPDIPERWKQAHRRALAGETVKAEEDCWERAGGNMWVRWESRPWRTPAGEIGGILIFAEEISRRKQAEEAFRDVSRKLIQSQEQERVRIARELHDDINQRLAVLAMELEQLQGNPSGWSSHLQQLRSEVVEISSDLHSLSHDLHSSKLEYLGAVAGMKSWCEEFSDRRHVEVRFHSEVPSVLPPEIGMCLFRVLQEALHNAVKHSGAKHFEVSLVEDAEEVHLLIRDSGKGFEIESANRSKGLGLTSMQERVRLVGGTLEIESRPMQGTLIRVGVPLRPEVIKSRAAVNG